MHFLYKNAWIYINISLTFVPEGQFNNVPTLAKQMAWRKQGDKPLFKNGPGRWRIYASLGPIDLTTYKRTEFMCVNILMSKWSVINSDQNWLSAEYHMVSYVNEIWPLGVTLSGPYICTVIDLSQNSCPHSGMCQPLWSSWPTWNPGPVSV